MQHADILALAGLRIDGRRSDELRKIKYKIGVETDADGSTYMEHGLNKVLVLVHGPREESRSRGAEGMDKGSLTCHVCHTPYSSIDRKPRKTVDRRTQEMEGILQSTFASVVMLELYAKSQINVVIHVIESDGSVVCTIMNAITLALMDAGVAMTDMVTACSVGYVKNEVCVDLTQLEQSSGVYLPLAIKARSKDVIYFQLDSRLSLEKLQVAMENGTEACGEIKVLLESAIKDMMSDVKHLQHA